MTKKQEIKNINNSDMSYKKLSIQISLNGLSFCVLDSIGNKILKQETIYFPEELNPYQILKKLKELFEKHDINKNKFSDVTVIHRNSLFSIVPKALFDEKELVNYLKFNAKILANDHVVYDDISAYDMVNVYVPFVNINNYIFELFGEFEYKHNGTVLIQSLLNTTNNEKEPICYVNVLSNQIDIVIIKNKKLVLFNSFDFYSKEDFIYYILFVIEQLTLNPETVKVKLFGAIEEGDELFSICHTYIRNVAVYIPSNLKHHIDSADASIDFTTLSAL